MSLPDVVSRQEWLVARKELLAREKALTRRRDASSFGSDFNYDFHVTLDGSVAPVDFSAWAVDSPRVHGLRFRTPEP